jgi:hypothetical protein
MTAIFAFVDGDSAFVAGDTKRGVYPYEVGASKVYEWSDGVVFAQAGDGNFQSKLIAQMRLERPLIQLHHPNFTDEQRLIEAFKKLQPSHYKTAVESDTFKKIGAEHITGTILVAAAQHGAIPARIHILDFSTGTVTLSSEKFEVAGSDRDVLSAIALERLRVLRVPNQPFQVDQWGIECVEAAIDRLPRGIGWPADLALVRKVDVGDRLVLLRRVHAHSRRALPEFAI